MAFNLTAHCNNPRNAFLFVDVLRENITLVFSFVNKSIDFVKYSMFSQVCDSYSVWYRSIPLALCMGFKWPIVYKSTLFKELRLIKVLHLGVQLGKCQRAPLGLLAHRALKLHYLSAHAPHMSLSVGTCFEFVSLISVSKFLSFSRLLQSIGVFSSHLVYVSVLIWMFGPMAVLFIKNF